MLPAVHRLRKSVEFSQTTRTGSRARRDNVLAYALVSGDDSPPRCGLIVGKQVGGSVQRHRVSRVLRAGLSLIIDDLPAGQRIVVRALPGAYEATDLQAQVCEAVRSASKRADSAQNRT